MSDSFLQFFCTRIVPSVVIALGTAAVSTKVCLYIVERTAFRWTYNGLTALFEGTAAQDFLKSVSDVDVKNMMKDVIDSLDTETVNTIVHNMADAINEIDVDKFVSAINDLDTTRVKEALKTLDSSRFVDEFNRLDKKGFAEAFYFLNKTEFIETVNALDAEKFASLVNELYK